MYNEEAVNLEQGPMAANGEQIPAPASTEAQITTGPKTYENNTAVDAANTQMTAEQAISELESSNTNEGLAGAEQELRDAEQQIATLTEETEAAAKAIEEDPALSQIAETQPAFQDTQGELQVPRATEDLQAPINPGEETTVQPIDNGALATAEVSQNPTEDQNVDQAAYNAVETSPNIQAETDPLAQQQTEAESQQPDSEAAQPAEDEDDRGPLVSIFG